MLGDELLFTNDDETDLEEELLAAWTVLVVDDEPEIHAVTRMVLGDFVFEQRPLNIITASSAAEARDILVADTHKAIAVAIIDVVMETTQAGLELVRWVRETLNNHVIRLILRTGQPGEAPEERVIRDYDINDYKNKTELTAMRLKTSMYAALRAYRDIRLIERHRQGLEKIIERLWHCCSCGAKLCWSRGCLF